MSRFLSFASPRALGLPFLLAALCCGRPPTSPRGPTDSSAGAAQSSGREEFEGRKRDLEDRIGRIRALKSRQLAPVILLRHLYETKPDGVWFLEITVDDPPSDALYSLRENTAGTQRPVAHIKGTGLNQSIIALYINGLERKKDWFPAVALRSIKAAPAGGEAGVEGREFELELSVADPAEDHSPEEKSTPGNGELADLEREDERLGAFMPVDEKLGDLLVNFNRVAHENNLRITRLEPQAEMTDRGYFSERRIATSVAGGYHDLAAFFDQIGRLRRIITIRSLRLKRGAAGVPGGRELNAEFEVVVYLRKPPTGSPVPPTSAPNDGASDAIQDVPLYDHQGEDDPFFPASCRNCEDGHSLLDGEFRLPAGCKRYKLEQLSLTGVTRTSGTTMAMLSAENQPYYVKVGDACGDAVVLDIDPKTSCVKWRRELTQEELAGSARPYKDVTQCVGASAPR